MVKSCKTDDCGKATQNGDDLCPLCKYRAKDGQAEFNRLKGRL